MSITGVEIKTTHTIKTSTRRRPEFRSSTFTNWVVECVCSCGSHWELPTDPSAAISSLLLQTTVLQHKMDILLELQYGIKVEVK